MPSGWTAAALLKSLNATLPDDVWVEVVHTARPDFHPRYDALARTYEYRVGSVADAASPFQRRWCWPLLESLDGALLASSATALLGRHSFLAFSKAGQPERGEDCTIRAAAWSGWERGERFTITADRYLHHMVRYLVGTMVDIARRRRPLSDLSRLLENDPELTTSPPAPPEGLFLSHVEYPDDVLLDGDTTPPPQTRSTAPA
jgi:tRNA pseudouridine38-40 synthase